MSSRRASPKSFARARARGVTLVEILVVMVIISLVVGGIIGGTGQLSSAKLKRATTMIAGGVKMSYTRATARSRNLRIVFDLDAQTMWLEEGDMPMLVQSKDKTGTGGAEAVTEAEKVAVAESMGILKGPKVPRARYKPVNIAGFEDDEGAGKGVRPLGGKITFRSVQTSHDDEPRTSGRAYLYFWPGGQTERASIQVRIGTSLDDGQTLTVLVSPLTGRVSIKAGPVPLPEPLDDRAASEREDR